jgi:hypothetical protein
MSSKKFWKFLFKKSSKYRNKDNRIETKIIEQKTSCSDDKIFSSSTQPKTNESNDKLNEYSKTKRTTDEKEMSKLNKFCKRMNGFREGCLKLFCCCRQKTIHKSNSHSSINEELDRSLQSESIKSQIIINSENVLIEEKPIINDRIEVQIDNCLEDKHLLDRVLEMRSSRSTQEIIEFLVSVMEKL